jgi:hypothetical protein
MRSGMAWLLLGLTSLALARNPGVRRLDPTLDSLIAVEASIAFGDPDLKTLYMACHTAIYKIRVRVAGLVP